MWATFLFWNALFLLSLSCYPVLCQYQTRWKYKACKNVSWHRFCQPRSTFCVAKLSTGVKITPHLFVISSLARESGKSSSVNGLCLSHTLSWAASLQHRPSVWSWYASLRRTRSAFSSSQGNHTLFSLLAVRLAQSCSSNIYPGKMKQHGKVTGGRRAEGMTQLWTWIQTKMSNSSRKSKKDPRPLIPVLQSDKFLVWKLTTRQNILRTIHHFAAPYLAQCPFSFVWWFFWIIEEASCIYSLKQKFFIFNDMFSDSPPQPTHVHEITVSAASSQPAFGKRLKVWEERRGQQAQVKGRTWCFHAGAENARLAKPEPQGSINAAGFQAKLLFPSQQLCAGHSSPSSILLHQWLQSKTRQTGSREKPRPGKHSPHFDSLAHARTAQMLA